jgi:hypothetical protein
MGEPFTIGRCRVKGCKHTTRRDDRGSFGTCPEHGQYRLEYTFGYFSDHPCNAKCMGAVGPSCDCSCGGANHGRNHAFQPDHVPLLPL